MFFIVTNLVILFCSPSSVDDTCNVQLIDPPHSVIHAALNVHLNRIQPKLKPECILYKYPSETVQHILFDCANLKDLRAQLLPPTPIIANTLYSSTSQLRSSVASGLMMIVLHFKCYLYLSLCMYNPIFCENGPNTVVLSSTVRGYGTNMPACLQSRNNFNSSKFNNIKQ
jgi:hypothetical protein